MRSQAWPAVILLASNRRGLERAEKNGDGWRVTNPLPGVRISSFATAVDGGVYAGSPTRGVLRSDDGGASWRPAGMEGRKVRALAASPHDAGTIYAGTQPAALYVSRDGGSTWSELEAFRRARRWYWLSPAQPPDVRGYVSGMSVSPADPDVLLVGIEVGGVLRSTDGGRSWSGHRRSADLDCHALTFHACDGAWAYEAGGGGPAVSRDGGETWLHPLEGLEGRYCMAVAADPARPEVWYVSASPMMVPPRIRFTPIAHVDGQAHTAIYRSSGGAAWTRLTGGLPQPLDHAAYALITDAQAPGHLYAGLASGEVWRTADHGDAWERLPVRFAGVHRTMIKL